MKRFIRRVDAERIAEIERCLIERIAARVGAGADPRMASGEEVHRALAQLDTASAAFTKALDALPSYPEAPDGHSNDA